MTPGSHRAVCLTHIAVLCQSIGKMCLHQQVAVSQSLENLDNNSDPKNYQSKNETALISSSYFSFTLKAN